MPIYEYQCDACGKSTESLRKMSEADAPIACTHCGSKKTHRQQSVFATATAGGAGGRDMSLPIPPCGRCGDPRGGCGMG